MSFDKTKLFLAGDGYYNSDKYATLSEALDQAKREAAKNFKDVPVYQAVQLVNAPVPKDITVTTLTPAS